MRINYSVNPVSKYFLLADVSFRQGARHIGLAMSGSRYGLSLEEKITHLALGVLKLIPVIGHLVALVDTLLQRKSITHLKLRSTTPFERGREHGLKLKKRIKEVYDPILGMKGHDPVLREKAQQLGKQIPGYLEDEMKGLAQGSGYSYEDVLLIHTFLDAQPGQFGCTSMAVKESLGKGKRIAAANHRVEAWEEMAELTNQRIEVRTGESQSRRQAFLQAPISKNATTEVLKSAGKNETIQAMVFEPSKGEVYLSSEANCAADGKFRKFGPDLLFDSHEFQNTESDNKVMLFRNLDWPWYFLGQETVVLTRTNSKGNTTVSISWPGYIGTLSGMNKNGLTLVQNSCCSEVDLDKIPNPLLFTYILDNCRNVDEADKIIKQKNHASSMNVVIADKTSAKSYELYGDRRVNCVDEIN